MRKKYTYEDVRKYIESFGCELLSSEYKNNKTKLSIKCSCGRVMEKSLNHFQKVQKCKYCTGNNFTYDYVKDYIHNHNCELLSSEYKNSGEKLKVRCSCGEIFTVDFDTFKKGQQQCKKCGMKIRNKKRMESTNSKIEFYSYEKVKSIIENNSTTKLISKEYNGCFEKIELKCECGNHFKQTFNYINQKIKNNQKILCPSCIKEINDENFRWTEKEINQKLFNKYKYQKFSIYDYENYTNKNGKNKFIHNECGHIFECSLSSLLYSGRLCPNCERKYSKGVYNIIHYLNENNIEYIQEKSFDDCRYKRKLFFDFYLPKYNCCIEYDGEQHTRPSSFYNKKVSFNITQKRDKIKDEYCIDNNIPLLRISYKENDFIDKKINNFINKLIPR